MPKPSALKSIWVHWTTAVVRAIKLLARLNAIMHEESANDSTTV